ncbi:AfsR/SARP family transcriptional regulator [Winogradskya humida]|uniref:SARP family transcriptional regulator n=1 Tax=Winogradskya humida TaxID=113566 RepID=A0ABQ3ZGV8_9ACTN|nr:BTAD domain-containing putative transcriptional regulator [Actinoplanes humidus]GIE17821.1 SARP family transcriptional regulator [Actinoplanes humidus]
MLFLILGALEVVLGDDILDLGGLRQQVVLGTMLLEANRVVRTPRLIEALYGEDPPSTSRVQVQICISALRRFFTGHGMPDAILTRSQGYSLQIPEGSLDLHRWEHSLIQARQSRDNRRIEEAVGQYRSALSLWRGPALDGVESQVVRSAAERLADRRITAHEECIDLELKLGRHNEIVDELGGLVTEYPLREQLRGQFMLALYRAGRQSEALATYRSARLRMIDELGLEPNEHLQGLERAILTSDPGLIPPKPAPSPALSQPAPPLSPAPGPVQEEELPVPAVPVAVEVIDMHSPRAAEQAATPGPRLLPTDIADFTGRERQIGAIEQHFTVPNGTVAGFAVPVVVIAGKPGIGKTTLAVHAAHRLTGRYPDGQLYADLHGRHIDQVSAEQVLERFLRALGVPGAALPESLDERAELYRTMLSDRRMLVVLDNAGDEGQIRPLLPGTSRSAVLVSSRGRLGGLPGAVHVDVDVFDEQHSMELLARIAGAERIDAEPRATAELAGLCGHLPLALRIAGARLAARPHWSVDHLVERLENEARRLDELKHSGLGIRASISLTYDHLEEDARRLFRLLTILNFPHFPAWVAAALLDQPFSGAQDLLDDLADAQLIETTSSGRGVHAHYRFHDLIRVFARERLVAEDATTEREAALERVMGALLFISREARRGVHGGDYLQMQVSDRVYPLPERHMRQIVEAPLTWFERERPAIVAAVRQAAQAGLVEHCWSLALTAVPLFESRNYLSDWRETHQIALAAAREAGDERGQAAMLYSTGSLHVIERRTEDARGNLTAAAEIFERVGDEVGAAMVNQHLGYVEWVGGRYAQADDRYSRALLTHRRNNDLVSIAYVLQSIAHVRIEHQEYEPAIELLTEALDLSRQIGNRRTEAQVLHRLGEVHRHAGRPAEAVEVLAQALRAVREFGDPTGEAYILHGLGVSRVRAGRPGEAADDLREAMRLACETGDRLVEGRVAMAQGELALAVEEPRQAVVHLHRALGLFRAIGAKHFEVRVLPMLSDAYAATGDLGDLLAPTPLK